MMRNTAQSEYELLDVEGGKLTRGNGGDEMADSLEEEQAGRSRCFDEHKNAGGDNGEEANDVHHTDCIENNVPGTG